MSYKSRILKTRKEHSCSACYKVFPKGTYMRKSVLFPSSGVDMLEKPLHTYYCGCNTNEDFSKGK